MSTTNNTAQGRQHLRVFLASPGDVAEERQRAQEILEQLPYDPLLRGSVTIETVAWDKRGAGAPLLASMTPQEAIAQGLPKPSACDIVIVIFWSRMGTLLPDDWRKPDGGRYLSGTEWEYQDALQAAEQHGKPKLLLYRRTEKLLLDPSDPAFMEKYQQWQQVESFFAALRNADGSIRGGCNEYTTLLQFKEDLTLHLRTLIRDLVPELPAALPGAGSVQPPRLDLRAATAHYLSYLLDRHQYLSLKGMGLSERVPLQLPLLDLYVPLQARLELPAGETWDRNLRLAGRLLVTDEQQEQASRLSEPQSVLDLLLRQDGLVILGDPGAGKTTFLKYLTLKLTRGESAELGLGERLPILAPLSGYANALEKGDIRLDDFIAGYFHDIGANLPLKALLTDALERGAALVLLDGLDEVQDESLRHLVVERVVDFYTLCRKAGNKFVITSRIIGYREVRRVATGLAECTLVDFNDEEIKTFVDHWTQALEKQVQGDTRLALADAERERHELLEAVERNTGVRQLAANPLLLTILALMKRQGVTLPERRVELYDQYVKTLLSTWNRARGLGRPPSRDLDPVQTVKILAPLALWMHEANPGVGLVKQAALCCELKAIYARRGELEPEVYAQQFLEDVRNYSGLLLERGPRKYGFIHLTFEEYLAAVAIALQAQGQVDAIVAALAAHVGEPAWHEIGLLTVGYLGLIQQLDAVAGSVVETLVSKQPGPPGVAVVLAGEATIDVGTVGIPSTSRERVRAALLETLQQDRMVPAEPRCRAGRALAALGDPRPGIGLSEDGLPDLRWVKIPGTETVRQSGQFPGFTELKLGESTMRLEIANFELAVYPVTVAQFRPFVEGGCYQENRYWSETGRQWRDREQWVTPRYWDDAIWMPANHPVIGVSWYEVEAYCNWLNRQLPSDMAVVRLPTEAEWEWVARGPERQQYPWGDPWESWRCNSEESAIRRTSAVGCFPGGAANWWLAIQPDSEVVHDLAGNVWEWTASEYTEDYSKAHQSVLNTDHSVDSPCVLRGGSWGDVPGWVRGAARNYRFPRFWDNGRGFRLARTFPFTL